MAKQLVETAASALAKSKNGRFRVVCATPGQGSSGNYSESVLRDFGPAALPAGSKSYINHDAKRDPRDLLGFFPEGAVYEEGVGLVAELEVLPHYKDLVEAVAPHTGMSIYMMGESDDDGNVTTLTPHRFNGCDLVGYPGLEGSGIVEKLYEAAREAASDKPTTEASVEEKKEINMEKEILEAVQAIAESLKPVVAFVQESAATKADETQATVDAEALETARAEGAKVAADSFAAIEAAELPAKITESLKAQVLEGADVTNAITSAKEIVEAALEESNDEDTHIIESASGEFAFPKGW